MTSIHDKDGVVALLERLGRVCREVKGLPSFAKRTMAVQAGCLESELDELEGLVTQACDVVREMYDADETPHLDITEAPHRLAIKDALIFIDQLDDDDQLEVLEIAIKESTVFDTDIERLNSMLEDAGKEWFVIIRSEATELKNLVDSMLPEQ